MMATECGGAACTQPGWTGSTARSGASHGVSRHAGMDSGSSPASPSRPSTPTATFVAAAGAAVELGAGEDADDIGVTPVALAFLLRGRRAMASGDSPHASGDCPGPNDSLYEAARRSGGDLTGGGGSGGPPVRPRADVAGKDDGAEGEDDEGGDEAGASAVSCWDGNEVASPSDPSPAKSSTTRAALPPFLSFPLLAVPHSCSSSCSCAGSCGRGLGDSKEAPSNSLSVPWLAARSRRSARSMFRTRFNRSLSSSGVRSISCTTMPSFSPRRSRWM